MTLTIDEDYCNDELDEKHDDGTEAKKVQQESSFLDEDRGKTFRIALYLLSKQVDEGKNYCRANYHAITPLLDPYENRLFVNAMQSL